MESPMFTLGRNAYSEDLDRADCPYAAGTTEAVLWLRGFEYAENNDPLADHNMGLGD